MNAELILDTGPLVALLDRSQRPHAACVAFFESWDGPIVSTEAVLTEATHLLGGLRGGRAACIDFFRNGGALLVPTSAGSLTRCRELVAKYSDQPMDYADATLVALAEELDTQMVFTIDRTDFEVYRIRGRKRFQVFPDLPPARRGRSAGR